LYLLDTNIFLELLLDQKESGPVRALLSTKNPDELGISDFALHSVGIILYQKKAAPIFSDFIEDLFGQGGTPRKIRSPRG